MLHKIHFCGVHLRFIVVGSSLSRKAKLEFGRDNEVISPGQCPRRWYQVTMRRSDHMNLRFTDKNLKEYRGLHLGPSCLQELSLLTENRLQSFALIFSLQIYFHNTFCVTAGNWTLKIRVFLLLYGMISRTNELHLLFMRHQWFNSASSLAYGSIVGSYHYLHSRRSEPLEQI